MSEEIRKSFSGSPIKADAIADIDLINRYTLRELKPEEVFAFNINLCDDQPDRDFERFDVRSLRKLASMFPGKPLIQDHEWSAKNQQGRIYRAQVVQDWNVNRLRASVYMVRTPGTEETIKQIEGGVLKEVSVGFDIKKMTCSICGKPMIRSWLSAKCENEHEKGKEYSGQTCLGIMEDPSDAFEVSFVAVPSQREAGVTKGRVMKNGLSAAEWAERRQIIEKANGITFRDSDWNAIVEGKVSSAEVTAAYRKQLEENRKPKSYSDFIPEDDCSPGNIQFAMIPQNEIDDGTIKSAFRALGFCRKELQLQPIQVRWFATVQEARRLGLDTDKLRKFHYNPDCYGLASRKNPNQVLVRYPQSDESIMKTVFHECWHAFQMKDEYNPMAEDNAYWYQYDALKRYQMLSAAEKEDLYYGELSMKDYRKK